MKNHINWKYLIVMLIITCSCSSQQEQEWNEEDSDTVSYHSLIEEDFQDSISALPKEKLQRMRAIVKRIAEDKEVYLTRGVGYGGMSTIQYEYAKHLSDIASSWQMKRIALKHPSAVVRAAVFNALKSKDASAAVDVAIIGIGDTTIVETLSGCCGELEHINLLRTNALLINKEFYKVSDYDFDRLARIVLFSDSVKDFDAYGSLYEGLMPKPQYYQRLRDLYDKDSYVSPIVALIKYNKEEDKQLLADALEANGTRNRFDDNEAFFAVSLCPDKRYKDTLQKIAKFFIEKKIKFPRELYMALMAYEEPWTVSLIDYSMQNHSSKWEMTCAYEKNPRPYYKDLYNKSKKY